MTGTYNYIRIFPTTEPFFCSWCGLRLLLDSIANILGFCLNVFKWEIGLFLKKCYGHSFGFWNQCLAGFVFVLVRFSPLSVLWSGINEAGLLQGTVDFTCEVLWAWCCFVWKLLIVSISFLNNSSVYVV